MRLIKQSSATDIVEFARGDIQLVGIRLEANSPIIRKSIKDIWKEYSNLEARIVAINRKERTLIPRGDDTLQIGDQIFVICERTLISQVAKIAGKENVNIKNIMILGGGLIGRYVAQELEDQISIKIIESQIEKSEEISQNLRRSLVIHGDGTDIDLLASEGIVDMDCFIAVTGDDENNIISTLMARHLKVPRTIALINKTEYLPITPTIGMDAVVSKKLITVNTILRFIQKSAVENLVSIPGVNAEIIEVIAKAGSKITKKSLKNVQFPRAAIVGAVHRDNKTIIPTGNTQIKAKDRVVIFSLPSALAEVEKLFE